jgi:hypothetical protein
VYQSLEQQEVYRTLSLFGAMSDEWDTKWDYRRIIGKWNQLFKIVADLRKEATKHNIEEIKEQEKHFEENVVDILVKYEYNLDTSLQTIVQFLSSHIGTNERLALQVLQPLYSNYYNLVGNDQRIQNKFFRPRDIPPVVEPGAKRPRYIAPFEEHLMFITLNNIHMNPYIAYYIQCHGAHSSIRLTCLEPAITICAAFEARRKEPGLGTQKQVKQSSRVLQKWREDDKRMYQQAHGDKSKLATELIESIKMATDTYLVDKMTSYDKALDEALDEASSKIALDIQRLRAWREELAVARFRILYLHENCKVQTDDQAKFIQYVTKNVLKVYELSEPKLVNLSDAQLNEALDKLQSGYREFEHILKQDNSVQTTTKKMMDQVRLFYTQDVIRQLLPTWEQCDILKDVSNFKTSANIRVAWKSFDKERAWMKRNKQVIEMLRPEIVDNSYLIHLETYAIHIAIINQLRNLPRDFDKVAEYRRLVLGAHRLIDVSNTAQHMFDACDIKIKELNLTQSFEITHNKDVFKWVDEAIEHVDNVIDYLQTKSTHSPSTKSWLNRGVDMNWSIPPETWSTEPFQKFVSKYIKKITPHASMKEVESLSIQVRNFQKEYKKKPPTVEELFKFCDAMHSIYMILHWIEMVKQQTDDNYSLTEMYESTP